MADLRQSKRRQLTKSVSNAKELEFISFWDTSLKFLTQKRATLDATRFNSLLDELTKSLLATVEIDRTKYLLKTILNECLVEVFHTSNLWSTNKECRDKSLELMQAALSFSLRALRIMSLKSKLNETTQSACKLIGSIFSNTSFKSLVDAEKLSTEEERKQFAQTVAKIFTYEDSDRSDAESSEDIDIYSFIEFNIGDAHWDLLDIIENESSKINVPVIHAIIYVVVSMNQVHSSPQFLKEYVPQLVTAVSHKLLTFGPFFTDSDRKYFDEIKEILLPGLVLKAQIGSTQLETFAIDYASKVFREFSTALSVLFVDNKREKSAQRVEVSKMVTVYDTIKYLAYLVHLTPAEIVLTTVKNGQIVKLHAADQLATSLVPADADEIIVAYQVHEDHDDDAKKFQFCQVIQTTPVDKSFVPFLLCAEKQLLTGKLIHEQILNTFLFPAAVNHAAPYKLKTPSGEDISSFNKTVDLSPKDGAGSPSVRSARGSRPSFTASTSPSNSPNASGSSAPAAVPIVTLEWIGVQPEYVRSMEGLEVPLKLNKLLPIALPILNALGEQKKLEKFLLEFDQQFKTHSESEGEKLNESSDTNAESPRLTQSKKHKRFTPELQRGWSILKYVIRLLNVPHHIMQTAALKFIRDLASNADICHMMQSELVEVKVVDYLKRLLRSSDQHIRIQAAETLCQFDDSDVLFYQFDGEDRKKRKKRHKHKKTGKMLTPALQFLYKLNFFRVIDEEYLSLCPKTELVWYLPLIIKTLNHSKQQLADGLKLELTEHSQQHLISTLLAHVKESQYLAQTAFWMQETNMIRAKDFPNLEWVAGLRFQNSLKFYRELYNASGNPPDKGTVIKDLDILDPVYEDESGGNNVVTEVTVKKVFSSKAKPLLLEMKYKNANKKPNYFIFKKGDDLRQDLLVQVMFFVFNTLWKNSNMPLIPFIYQYKIIPMGFDIGAVEFVQPCESLQTFDWTKIKSLSPEEKKTLFCSAAGSYVAGWVLGIRDRHQDNMMMRNNCLFFHIDFGKVFNEKPTIDAPRFAIATEMKLNLGDSDWEDFKQICADAFTILHRNAGLIANLCCILFDGLDVDTQKIRNFLLSPDSLMITMSEADARTRIKNLIESGVNSFKKNTKWGVHTMFVNANK